MKKTISSLMILLQATFMLAQSAPSHSDWDALLKKNVTNDGKVSYKSFKKDKAKLDAYCDLISNSKPSDTWKKEDLMAFWINAYNAYTIKLVTDNYPISSIQKLDGGKPWDVKRITINGTKFSLNDIENNVLRKNYKDPRIHFAVNCAAKSCPTLLNKAFTGANLNASLDAQATKFVNNTDFNTLSKSSASVSKIFDWYAVDFGDLTTFLNKYATNKLDKGAKITFQEYKWTLNE